MPLRRTLLAALCACAFAVAAAPASATLSYRTCVRDNEATTLGCPASAPSLAMLAGIEVEPGGGHLYTTSFADGGVQVWNRSGTGGNPSFVRCFMDPSGPYSGGPPECGSGSFPGLQFPKSIAISPDGRNVYVSGTFISIFNRDPTTGDLSYAGCAGNTGSSCAITHPGLLYGAAALDLSPDGESLYAVGTAAAGATLSVFDRNTGTGALTAAGCFKRTGASESCANEAPELYGSVGVGVAPDGGSVYVANRDTDSVTEFQRASGPGHPLTAFGCIADDVAASSPCGSFAEGIQRAMNVSFAADGRTVIATGDLAAVSVLARDPATSGLTFSGCIRSNPTTASSCAPSANVGSAGEIYLTPDNRNVYAGGHNLNGLVVYARDPATGFLSFVECVADADSGPAGTFTPTCSKTANGLEAAHEMAVSPDGSLLYVTAGYLNGQGALLTFDRTADSPPPPSAPTVPSGDMTVPSSAASAALRLTCPTGVFEFCRGELTATPTGLSGSTHAAASKSTKVAIATRTKKSRATIKLKLSSAVRKALKQKGSARVKVSFQRFNATGTKTKAKTRTVTLRVKRKK